MRNESNSAHVARPPLHKRRYIVDEAFQYRLIGTLSAIWLANSLFFTLVLYFLYEGHLTAFYDLVPREGMSPLLSLPALFVTSILFVSAFGMAVLTILALYMSNQIAGPLHRVKKCFARVAEGDLSFELRFRHGDFLRDLPDDFNEMVASLRRSTEADLEALNSIEAVSGQDEQVLAALRRLSDKKQSTVSRESEVAVAFRESPSEPAVIAPAH